MSLIALIAVFILFVSQRALSARIRELERKISEGKLQPAPAPALSAAAPTQPVAAAVSATPAQPSGLPGATFVSEQITTKPQASAEGRFSAWVKEDWLMKLGALLFIIGVGWFVSYAFANNWIGPIGRISIGIGAGAALMLLGYWRMLRYPAQGAVFLALGAGTVMLTIFAGRAVYQFFTPVSAVLFDFAVAAFASFASYKFNVRALALIAQMLAFAAPLLTAGPTDAFFLFSYMLLISLATVGLAALTGWRDLIVSSLLFVLLYSIPYFGAPLSSPGSQKADEAMFLINFAYVFAVLYFIVGIFAVIRRGVQKISYELWLAALNGLFLFLWIGGVVAEQWRSLIFAAWAVVFTAGSFIAFRHSEKPHTFYAYGSVAVAFIAAAAAAELEGAMLTIALTFEILAIEIAILSLTGNVRAALNASLLFLGPAIMSIANASAYLGAAQSASELFTKDFFVLVILAFSLITAGRLIGRAARDVPQSGVKDAGAALVVFGTLYIWVTVWGFIHIAMRDAPDMATMTTLLIYTVAGLIAYFAGIYGEDAARRVYGAALLGFVVVRLVGIDVWDMELFGRVVTFVAIGALLMSTAFLTKKHMRKPLPQPLAPTS